MIYFIQYTVDKWEVYVLISKSEIEIEYDSFSSSNVRPKIKHTCTKIVYKITSVLIIGTPYKQFTIP